MANNKGSHLHSSNFGGSHSHSHSHSHRGRPYALMLLLAFGAALLGVMLLHKLRERRIYNLIVQDKDRQLISLQLLLKKERDHAKEMKRKNEEMKAKIYTLRSQKMELDRRVVEMQSTMDSLKEEQTVMESAFEEKQNELRTMQEKGSNLGQGGSEVMVLTENLKQKEAEIKELMHRVGIQVKPHLVTVTANGTMSAQDKTETQNEHLHKSAKHGGDDKHITSEDASKSKLTESKDGEAKVGVEGEVRNDDRIIETDEHTQKLGTWKVEGTGGGKITQELRKKNEDHPQDDGGEGVISKNIDDGGQELNAKQSAEGRGVAAGAKRNHARESRTKGNWRSVVKNRLQGNNGISESHEVGRKAYRDEKSGLKDAIVKRVSDDDNVVRGEEAVNNDKPGKDRAHANLLKPEKHEDTEKSRKMIVNNTNHHVTDKGINVHPEKQRLDEMRNSEEQDGLVQQNWNRRHINKADNDGGEAKPNIFHDEPEDLEAVDAQKQVKDVIDGGDDGEDNDEDFSKESQSDFEDEKEYKEETDESEFHTGL